MIFETELVDHLDFQLFAIGGRLARALVVGRVDFDLLFAKQTLDDEFAFVVRIGIELRLAVEDEAHRGIGIAIGIDAVLAVRGKAVAARVGGEFVEHRDRQGMQDLHELVFEAAWIFLRGSGLRGVGHG